MQMFSPNLPSRKNINSGNCSSIADIPIHLTSPDKQIGPEAALESRRAKFIAVSRLTPDYLDTSGIVKTFEGELENADILSLVRQYNQGESNIFGWKAESPEDQIDMSTFKPRIHHNQFTQVLNSNLVHNQYETSLNDRLFYSPACVYDNQCLK